MPTRPARACRTPTCPHPATHSSYCDACRAHLGLTDKPSQTGSHWANWNTGTSTARGYGAAWRKVRTQVLQAADYLCTACRQHGRITLAREVHHRIPRVAGGTDAIDNLEARCTACHRIATAQMRRSTRGGP